MKARKYRQLAPKEIVRKGDEYRYGRDKGRWVWVAAADRIGCKAGEGCVYRRLVVPEVAETSLHTPGPWKNLGEVIVSETINDYGNFVVCGIQRDLTPQDCANAQLISAAPELIEALKFLLIAVEETGEQQANLGINDWLSVRTARAAIAKAEGRT